VESETTAGGCGAGVALGVAVVVTVVVTEDTVGGVVVVGAVVDLTVGLPVVLLAGGVAVVVTGAAVMEVGFDALFCTGWDGSSRLPPMIRTRAPTTGAVANFRLPILAQSR